MDLLGQILSGFAVAAQPENLLFLLIGTLLGTIIGLLPGLGPVSGIRYSFLSRSASLRFPR
jgi:putative tricarboxylic transport membrane protein